MQLKYQLHVFSLGNVVGGEDLGM